MNGVRVSAEDGNFSLHHRVQTGSGAHPAYYPMDTRSSCPGGKEARTWSWPITSIYSRGQRMRGTIRPLSNTPSRSGVQFKKHRNNFTFTLLYVGVKWAPCRHAVAHCKVPDCGHVVKVQEEPKIRRGPRAWWGERCWLWWIFTNCLYHSMRDGRVKQYA
jgi:hypothetical protein